LAKHSSNILEMARKGAEHRYQELKAEIAALMKHFPHLRGFRGQLPYPMGLEQTELPTAPRKRHRRKMSAAARKKISDAQTARWAKQRGEK
jgi:hypothetical protein